MSPTCPTCKRPSAPRATNRAFPFCSDRCRLLDLGRWMDGGYRIAGERAGDGASGQSRPDDEELQ